MSLKSILIQLGFQGMTEWVGAPSWSCFTCLTAQSVGFMGWCHQTRLDM